MNCPHCKSPIKVSDLSDGEVRSEFYRRRGATGGRPRSDAPRCPCGSMTRIRAEKRGHKCEVVRV